MVAPFEIFLGGKSMSSTCCFCSSHSDCLQEWTFSPEHDVLVTAEKWHEAVTMAVLHEEIQKIMCKKI